ncbi:7-cyano-7-deazaguanine synthase [Candidatus Pacearchaeota archaeon]|nr:7-cyano-7-deazaguanine synthase [Candidatus Pacearchaeota archaeon]
MKNSKNALILCSGGLDSVVTAFYIKKKLNYNKIKALFFDYKQKSVIQERRYAKLCAKKIEAEFIEIKLHWLGKISTSLINKNGKIKKLAKKDLKNTKKESKKFYVPCRNSIFLINALALAELLFMKEKEIYDIFVGFKCEGKESYPDTTKEFVKEINRFAKISCSQNFKIIAPLIKKDKEDIIKLGKRLNVIFNETFSCYVSKNSKQCGVCLACKLRQAGFYWANIYDPTIYKNKTKF